MYHIHVYFTAAQKDDALRIRSLIETHYPTLRLGRVFDRPIGPHPAGSFEIDVPDGQFDAVRAFLDANNTNLSMMIHPVTGDDIDDHNHDHVQWIGPAVEINRTFFDTYRPH
jgi:DOPA 4,5-dioxygenase